MTDFLDSLPDWDRSPGEICSRIRDSQATLKIILKTKDDPFMFPKWVQHHERIVGLRNIVVFDNHSSHSELDAMYASVAPAGIVARFGGFHNRIHRVHEFPELYDAIRASCSFFVFLDTDEFLVRFSEDGTIVQDKQILDHLQDATDISVVPGTWLENVSGCETRFWMKSETNHLVSGLRSGKPLISSSINIGGMINHNWQVGREYYSARIVTNFFVLHLKRLSVKQRISANLTKLRAYGAIGKDVTLEEVLKLNPDAFAPGNKRAWIKEIQKLWSSGERVPTTRNLSAGTVELDNGILRFSSGPQEAAFREFVANPSRFKDEIFRARQE